MSATTQTTERVALTRDTAEAILGTMRFASEAGPHNNVVVASIKYTKRVETNGVVTEEPFMRAYEGMDPQPYALVNLRIMTAFQQELAEDYLESGEFQLATNQTMSMGLNVVEARKLSKGSLVNITVVENWSDKHDRNELFVSNIVPAAAIEAKKSIFAIRLEAKKKAAAEAKAQALLEEQARIDAEQA